MVNKDRGHHRFSRHAPSRLFSHPRPEVGRDESEGGVLGELALADGRQGVTVLKVVNVVQRVTSALEEKGDEQGRVVGLAKRLGQRLDLPRVVPPAGSSRPG